VAIRKKLVERGLFPVCRRCCKVELRHEGHEADEEREADGPQAEERREAEQERFSS
jgi:hypothetical protein